jgi:hypothetical protein
MGRLMLLRVRQGTSQWWTDTLAGSRERSNSHDLSMLHPTRVSLSESGATPQAAQRDKLSIELSFTVQSCTYTTHHCVR